jgi:hypothetical protein
MQAQGEGVEESVPWNADEPPSGDDGHAMLDELNGKLTPAEQGHREEAFRQAHMFVSRAERAGGVDAPYKRSFFPRPRSGRRRVDIEVLTGRAFVPTPSSRGG